MKSSEALQGALELAVQVCHEQAPFQLTLAYSDNGGKVPSCVEHAKAAQANAGALNVVKGFGSALVALDKVETPNTEKMSAAADKAGELGKKLGSEIDFATPVKAAAGGLPKLVEVVGKMAATADVEAVLPFAHEPMMQVYRALNRYFLAALSQLLVNATVIDAVDKQARADGKKNQSLAHARELATFVADGRAKLRSHRAVLLSALETVDSLCQDWEQLLKDTSSKPRAGAGVTCASVLESPPREDAP